MVVGDFAIELDTVVIGAGPGGYVAAIRAAQLGQKVAVIEREYIGGVCLNVGCIPSKALIAAGHHYQEALDSQIFGVNTDGVTLDFDKTQDWKENGVVKKLTTGVSFLLKKNKVDVITGSAFFVDDHTLRVINGDSAQTYSFNNAIVATGSRPIEIKGFKFGFLFLIILLFLHSLHHLDDLKVLADYNLIVLQLISWHGQNGCAL